MTLQDDQNPVWTPSPERIAQANLTRFINYVNQEHQLQLHDYADLYRWSIKCPRQFWPAVWRFCDVRASEPWQSVIEDGYHMPGARWFEGAKLNFAENLLRRRDNGSAIVFWAEDKCKRELSYQQLYDEVSRMAAALKNYGIKPGDRVAGFLPNMPETVIAMLACSSVGATWSSCSPDFGVNGASERFSQIKPKLLFTADGYWFKGQAHDSLVRAQEIADRIISIHRIVVIPYINAQPDITHFDGAVLWPEFIQDHPPQEIEFAQLPFDHPLYILYSSGTTGLPKCIVHGAGGTLLQHLKELVLHTDLKAGQRIFYYTTCGWMMWNWLVSALAVEATLMLYDGSPFHPREEVLFDYAESEKINIFGTSAKYLAALEKTGAKPGQDHDLSALNTILSTGSPLLPESYDYVYRHIKTDLLLASISGGTDIVSCFALGNPLLPVYRGELQCRGLGMKVSIYNEQGFPVRDHQGELVCEAPAPSMPISFFGDPNGKRYRQAYFERFPGVWAHGDYALLTKHDGLIIYGRSDAVLNPGGVRIGTAEIYRQVEKLPQVLESIAVGQQWQDDVRIILFVKLRPGLELDNTLISDIKTTIRNNTSPRHVPAKIIAVSDIPRTISGKIVELAVRNVIHGRPVTNIEALANPEALALFQNLAQLATD